MTTNPSGIGEVEFSKIPLWKLVDANYVYEKEDSFHHNGILKKIEFTNSTLDSEVDGDKPSDSYKVYSAPLNFVYSSMTMAAYKDVPKTSNSEIQKLQKVETITAPNQFAVDGGRIYFSLPSSQERDIFVSPSDFTRVPANGEWVQGMSGYNTIKEGIKYNNEMCIGYFTNKSESLYDDDGDIISPGFLDKTKTPRELFYVESSPGVWSMRSSTPDSEFNFRRIAMNHRELESLRDRMLSSVCLARIGNVNGGYKTVDRVNDVWQWTSLEPGYELDGCPVSILTPNQIASATPTSAGGWDSVKIDIEFKSTNSGAYLKIKNNNNFDVFILNMEIWGLWVVRQSESGEFGGAILQSEFVESNIPSKGTIESDNEFVLTPEQAKDIASIFLDHATTMRHTISEIDIPHARYLEIGDSVDVTIPEICEDPMRFVVVSKSISHNKTTITIKLTRANLSLASLQNSWKEYQVKKWSKTF